MPVIIQCDPYRALHSRWRLAVGTGRVVAHFTMQVDAFHHSNLIVPCSQKSRLSYE